MPKATFVKKENKQGSKGWKADSKDGKFLSKLLKEKKISPGTTPRALKEVYPQFQVYKNDSFASGFRRLKTKYGCNVRGNTEPEDEEEDDATLASEEEEEDEEEEDNLSVKVVSVKTPARFNSSSSTVSMGSAEEITGKWRPNYIKAVYTNRDMVQHQVVIILCPGGVGFLGTQDVSMSLEHYGTENYLAVGIKWPTWVTLQFFLKFTMKEFASQEDQDPTYKEVWKEQFMENFVLMSHAVKAEMAAMRPQPSVSTLKADTKIKLDIPVKPITPNDWHFVGDSEGVRLLFVDLKAPKENSLVQEIIKAVKFDQDGK